MGSGAEPQCCLACRRRARHGRRPGAAVPWSRRGLATRRPMQERIHRCWSVDPRSERAGAEPETVRDAFTWGRIDRQGRTRRPPSCASGRSALVSRRPDLLGGVLSAASTWPALGTGLGGASARGLAVLLRHRPVPGRYRLFLPVSPEATQTLIVRPVVYCRSMKIPTDTLINYVLGSLDPVMPTKETIALVLLVLLLRLSFWVAAMVPIVSALDGRPSTTSQTTVVRSDQSRTTTTFDSAGRPRRVDRTREVTERCTSKGADAPRIRACGQVMRVRK